MGRAVAAALALAVLGGCGSGGGVEAGATVNVYVGAGLCAGARQALGGQQGKAGDLEVRARCLSPAVDPGAKRFDLATQGANARRASEDSTAVAFLEAPGRPGEFAQPIVAEAGIAFVTARSGAAAMERVVAAVEAAGDSASLREKVADTL